MEIKEYADLVDKTREAQRQFFKLRKMPAVAAPYLEKSKELEKQLDKVTAEIRLGQKQGDLF